MTEEERRIEAYEGTVMVGWTPHVEVSLKQINRVDQELFFTLELDCSVGPLEEEEEDI